jgi:SAM-dependent methyltransferase
VARSRARQRLGAWYTPPELVSTVVDHVITAEFVERRTCNSGEIQVLDPACGDGRFLAAAERRIIELGGRCELTGVDIDPRAVAATLSAIPRTRVHNEDALVRPWAKRRFDVVIGNPPFLSQMSAVTSRGGASARGGGPYADAAAEFLALSGELVDADGGRVALVLPQTLLATRDAAEVRRSFDERAEMFWSWWTGDRVFEAQVHTCALAFEFGRPSAGQHGSWAHVVTSRSGVPELPTALEETSLGALGDRASLNANFRDEYYGMIPAVGDHLSGPRLITSGLIDPGRSLWGDRPVKFAKQRFDRPRVDLTKLDSKMSRWAEKRLVPKVLVANQTRVIEAVCDPDGQWLPAVPVIAVYPHGQKTEEVAEAAWKVAAVLTSPIASAWLWHRSGGSGMSASSVRVGPVVLADLPWPSGNLESAVAALQKGDIRGCARVILDAYDSAEDDVSAELYAWWVASLERIEARQPSMRASAAPSVPSG